MEPLSQVQQNAFDFFDPSLLPQSADEPRSASENYNAEGSFPDDFENGADEGQEQGDAKRRRIARACDMCRKKKIKCDGKTPSCTNCQNYKTECIFTHVEKKRNPPKGAKYIEGLENRLGRMESLLRLSGLLSAEDAGKTDLGALEKRLADQSTDSQREASSSKDSDTGSARRANNATSQGASPPQPSISPARGTQPPEPRRNGQRPTEDVGSLSDMMCSLLTDNCGETRYIGSSSGFSIFSPKGIQWVSEKTGDTSFQNMIYAHTDTINTWVNWPSTVEELFRPKVYFPLPPKHEALSLLKDYFENFNCIFPLFHEPTFMHLLEAQYTGKPVGGSGWWASLNVAFALAMKLRIMSRVATMEEDTRAWGYIKNALAVHTELTIRNVDLLSVQALLGLALFLAGTPNPQPSFYLVAAAMRIAHSIGLHKNGSGFGLSAEEMEQRKRVFWIAYMMDRDMCLRSGRPPIQDDDDRNVELPSRDPPDNIGDIPLADGKGKVNIFRMMITFSIIQSNVYKRLYSVKAFKQSDGELLNTIGELDKELEDWKMEIPIDFRPEHEINASHTPLILHVVVMHFAYYNCLATIHRMSVHHGVWTSRLSNFALQGLNVRPLNPRVFMSAALCVTAARASIHLIRYIPQNDFACVWLILYYPVSALVTLFANILQNPQDSRARSDLKLMHAVVSFLSVVTNDGDNSSASRMLSVCSEFERIARVVLDRTDREKSRRKRKQNDDDQESDPTSSSLDARASRERSRAPAIPHKQQQQHQQQQQRSPANAPPPASAATPGSFGAAFPGDFAGEPFPSFSSPPAPTSPSWLADITTDPSMAPPPASTTSPFSPGFAGNTQLNHHQQSQQQSSFSPGFNDSNHSPQTNGGGIGAGLDLEAFQQPFVPQDMWQMPMALEWDWADMAGQSGGGSFSFGGSGGAGESVQMGVDGNPANNRDGGEASAMDVGNGNHAGQVE